MTEKTLPWRETQTEPGRLSVLEAAFDSAVLRIGPAAWVSAVAPGAALLARCPDYPEAALPAAGRVANGCGLSPGRCRTSGVGEAVELASCCAWGDETLVRARARDLADAIAPGEVTGFSPAQYRARRAWNRRYAAYDWRPDRCAGGGTDWIAGRDGVSGAQVHLPADAVLIGRRATGDEAAVAIGDSNGCAAGATPERAMEAALLELVERDAAGRWWYARRRRPSLPAGLLSDWPELGQWLAERTRRTRLLDLTTDAGIPVVAAVATAPDGSLPALGFAARSDPAEAAAAAVAEMLGGEIGISDPGAARDPLTAEWRARAPAAMPPAGPPGPPPRAAPAGLEAGIAALARIGCRVVFADLTRPAFGVPVFRAVAPDLCHFKPRFGRRRLLAADARDLAPGRTLRPNPVPLLV